MKARILVGLMFVLAVALWLPRPEVAVPVEDFHVAMGTVVRMALYVNDPEQAEPLFAIARTEIAAVNAEMSHYAPDSEISRLNRLDIGATMAISPSLRYLLGRCLEIADRTGGAFDPTIGTLSRLWGFPEAVQPPEAAAIDSALGRVGYESVMLDDGGVALRRVVQLDLSAVAKGYAVDRAIAALQESGVQTGVIEAGGDLRFWGHKPDGRPWRFGVQHPRQPESIVRVADIGLPALATSGDYEQAFELDGRRYHHLLDPATGMPASATVSASVWTTSALEADALATAAFIMGPRQALTLAAATDNVEVLVFYENKEGELKMEMSPGLAGHVE
ncbi:MAG: FAD:protein FMN transferase [Candidatus Latescibacterota bacterium]|nr:FAD:protein FMN transferase [Candidatus Latescibacterota bacterium]